MNQAEQHALREAARYLEVTTIEDSACSIREIVPGERFHRLPSFPGVNLRITRLWKVDLARKTCFVAQEIQDGNVVYIAR